MSCYVQSRQNITRDSNITPCPVTTKLRLPFCFIILNKDILFIGGDFTEKLLLNFLEGGPFNNKIQQVSELILGLNFTTKEVIQNCTELEEYSNRGPQSEDYQVA